MGGARKPAPPVRQGRLTVGAERLIGEPQPRLELLGGLGGEGADRLTGRWIDGRNGHVESLPGRSDSRLAGGNNGRARAAFRGALPALCTFIPPRWVDPARR